MKNIMNSIKELKGINCEKSDEVVQLMYDITVTVENELGDSTLNDLYFTDYERYVNKDELDYFIMYAEEKCKKEGECIFDYVYDSISTIKDRDKEWFFYNGYENAFYNIKLEDLRSAKKDFIEEAIDVLKSKGYKG